jgi:hypothetical protein
MDDQVVPALAQSSATRAFEDLRGEVSLLRRAIEGLAAERRDQPDYGPTLESLATSNEEIRDWARKINERPAVRLTVSQIAEQIEAAAAKLRVQDGHQLALMHGHLTRAVEEVKTLAVTARIASEQVRREKIVGGLSFLSGFALLLLLTQIEFVAR